MKRLILAAGLFVATISTSLYAQTMDMRASIPFDFRIGSTVFPSGEYSIRNDNGILIVVGGHKSGLAMTVSADHPNTPTAKGTVEFSRYGDSYYLSKVWTPDSQTARATLKTPRETELASHFGFSGTTAVSLRTK